MMSNSILQKRLDELIELTRTSTNNTLYEILSTQVDIQLAPVKRLKTTAGLASIVPENYLISINDYFFEKHKEWVLEEVVAHELSHIICSIVYPRAKQAHGPEFRRIMQNLFGLSGRTQHNIDTSELVDKGIVKKRKRFTTECTSCGTKIQLTSYRINKLKRNPNAYNTTCCKAPLRIL